MPKALPSTEHNSAPPTHTTKQNLAKDNLGGRGQKINNVFSTCSSQGKLPELLRLANFDTRNPECSSQQGLKGLLCSAPPPWLMDKKGNLWPKGTLQKEFQWSTTWAKTISYPDFLDHGQRAWHVAWKSSAKNTALISSYGAHCPRGPQGPAS